jgi:hypothetical protein
MVFSAVSCSPSSTPQVVPKLGTPNEKQLSSSELLKLYDPSSLVEAKTLGDLPSDLQSVLGVHATGYERIADVGEPCNPTDVVGPGPTRCFFVGGISAASALVAFKIGGFAGQSGVGEAYVRTSAGWVRIKSWDIGYPDSLKQLREMTSLPPDDRPPVRSFDNCFRTVDGKCSY